MSWRQRAKAEAAQSRRAVAELPKSLHRTTAEPPRSRHGASTEPPWRHCGTTEESPRSRFATKFLCFRVIWFLTNKRINEHCLSSIPVLILFYIVLVAFLHFFCNLDSYERMNDSTPRAMCPATYEILIL